MKLLLDLRFPLFVVSLYDFMFLINVHILFEIIVLDPDRYDRSFES